MSMNKAEKARLEDLERDLAFRWPNEPEPVAQLVPVSGGPDAEGYRFNIHTGQTERRWSKPYLNGGFFGEERTSVSQGGVRLYATERQAIVAMRWELCRHFAQQLRAVDMHLDHLDNPTQ